jgi:hypothetical protein
MIPDALERAGYRVERHSDHFAHDAADVDFLPKIGEHLDWIFLTHDARQRYRPDERDAIMRSGVAHIIHVGKLRHEELADSFVLAAPKIIRFREKYPPPFIAKLHRPEKKTDYRVVAGELKLVLTREQWERYG